MAKSLVSCFFDSRCTSGVWNHVPEGNTLIYGDTVPKYPYNTVLDRCKEASVPKTGSNRPVVSKQYWLVTDRRTDRWTKQIPR